MISRRGLIRGVYANLKFRVQGSTDEKTEELRQGILDAIAGQRVIDLQRLGPDVLAGILPLLYKQVLEEAWAHQDAGRPVYIVTAASHELAEVLAAVLVLDGGIGMRSEVRDGVYTGEPDGPFTYRDGKAAAITRAGPPRGHRPGRLLRLLGLRVRPAHDARGRATRWRSTPTPRSRKVARQEGWRVMRFDRLGPILKIGAGVLAVGLVGGGGGYAAARARGT